MGKRVFNRDPQQTRGYVPPGMDFQLHLRRHISIGAVGVRKSTVRAWPGITRGFRKMKQGVEEYMIGINLLYHSPRNVEGVDRKGGVTAGRHLQHYVGNDQAG